jgi:uncharacterized protein (TIGR02145 family)
MKKIKLLILLLVLLQTSIALAQKVSNISFSQEQSTIVVSYDLEVKTPCKVSLYVSIDSGLTWQGPLTKVSGDVGNKVCSGSRSITWSVLDEYKELRGNKIKFQVRAKSDNIETVKIGAQEWTTKNLDVTKYRNGDVIPEVKDPNVWASLKKGAWCYYNNDPKNGSIYGRLYNWYAVNDPRGLAPEGFHIPSVAELTTLNDYLGGILLAGGKMKEKGTVHWIYPNKVDTESIGFTALPGGARWCGNENWIGKFDGIGGEGFWWLSTEYDSLMANNFSIRNYMPFLYSPEPGSSYRKTSGLSVRCLRD